MIKEAAILKDGVVYAGRRHSDIIIKHYPLVGKFGCGEIQGFVDDKGKFLNRQEAANVAFLCGQTMENKQTLYSEDLY